ncbi:apolipoprotein N-acyltransferase [Sulfurospirillum diekertiae]|uniref:Apolipoprotein N-acyltransferase n=1 Tax=Sulfurospirillum diekertiae TaxID=1854492 RepID=A0A6G9VPT7_9BACT|nr:apolipoprotein N-acyltransferase [Sulfurospirillum diekertiae]QIR75157.1 apolipoprotein N-acyltransferase [Sulfurospirillum diekertiae]QIR77821.1 apolipoprotein N-acyltransferase [Sulfurospirillum diekertiae]
MKKNLDIYFTRIYIIKAFVIALCLCAFIYLAYFKLTFLTLNSLLALTGFYLLLGENRIVWFWSGFFTGLLWFYWISFSFVYYDLVFLIPFIILGIALVYGFLFWLIGRLGSSIYVQLPLLFGISFVDPFRFNWLKLQLTLIDTYFSTSLLSFGLFLSAITLFKVLPKWTKSFAVIPLIAALSFHSSQTMPETPLDVAIPTMNIPQSQRWDEAYQQKAIDLNFALIEKAIAEHKELIILPESAFPLYLNRAPRLIASLKKYSEQIAIVAGSLTYEEDQGFFNSSYLFLKGEMQIAHKIILVPFGEEVPFPAFIVEIINKLFFDGAKDYQKAKAPQDFVINGVTFRSAICYEGTNDKLFVGNPKQMIVVSNNAWFTPSTEQTLQYLLLRYYAKKYQTIIYHSANSGKSGIIYP